VYEERKSEETISFGYPADAAVVSKGAIHRLLNRSGEDITDHSIRGSALRQL